MQEGGGDGVEELFDVDFSVVLVDEEVLVADFEELLVDLVDVLFEKVELLGEFGGYFGGGFEFQGGDLVLEEGVGL